VPKKGLGGLGAILKNQKREISFDYSAPIFTETLSIYTPLEKVFDFNTIADLKGKTIGIKSGFSYGEAFEKARKEKLFKVVGVKNDLQNFTKMLNGRSIDCLITDKLISSIYIKQNNLTTQIKKLEKAVLEGEVFLVFAKSAGKTELLKQFNQALAEMKKDGSYQKLIQHFINQQNA